MFEQKSNQPITVLGITFNTEEERRDYFRNELRKKLPELKQMEGFPIGEDEDIINLSDPPYYTACPNPWLNDFIAEWEEEKKQLEEEGKRTLDFEVDEPYASDVSEGKYDPLYKFHPYPTKVPHKAIMRYILHYTEPGDVVFDGFAGTGMTGVAAQLCGDKRTILSMGYSVNDKNEIFVNKNSSKNIISKLGKRKAILNDLSTAGSFISYNYNSPENSANIYSEAQKILSEVKSECDWMYETLHSDGKTKGRINYVLWSDVYLCPNCNSEIIFWDQFVVEKTGKILEQTTCPHCEHIVTKRTLLKSWITTFDLLLEKTIKQTKQVPILINYSVGKKRFKKQVDKYDTQLITKISEFKFDIWVPKFEVPIGDKTNEPKNVGITHSHHFYTKRNLYALGLFNSKISNLKLKLFVTKLANQITKMYRFTYMSGVWGAGGGPMAGTLYIPSLCKELNILKQIETAISQRKKITTKNKYSDYAGSTGSFASLETLQENSCDYIFIDPPFGSNLNYSELSFLWESWLGCKTNIKDEAIESRSQKKGMLEYQQLITSSFRNAHKALKPGKWMTVEFSNTKASVWNSIQTSISNSGFIIANVSALDKQKGTYNAQASPTSVKQDLVISCYKPSKNFDNKFLKNQNIEVGVWDFIEEHLNHLPIHLFKEDSTTAIIERSPKILFDRLIAFYFQRGLIPIDASKFQQGLRERFIERDGMFFTNEQVQEYDKKKAEAPTFIQLSLLVSSEQDGVYWLKNLLKDKALTYQDIQPQWMQALAGVRTGDIIPELADILEENLLKNQAGQWYLPDPENEADLEKLRNKRLLKQFETYKIQATVARTKKIKEVRVDALRAGFKQCYQLKDFFTIVHVCDKIPNNLLMEDEMLLQFYDIASSRV